MNLAPTPRDTLQRDGTAQLYRFRRPANGPAVGEAAPLLLVPSLINRWFVLDLRAGASLAAAMQHGGQDTFCLDWGVPEDEDRYLTWDDVIGKIGRAVRAVKRATGAKKVSLLGYCIGGTLSGIYTALNPDDVAALVNLAGPFDFKEGGFLQEMTDPRWFDPQAIADAGNVTPRQMQDGFKALRPTATLAKWVGFADRALDPKARESFFALEAWAGDNIPFPAAAYATYIRELYQQNLLVAGEHRVGGQRVDLGEIRCPVMTIVAERDTICPPRAATALNEKCGSTQKKILVAPGGHVGAVVGGRASTVLYPAITSWLTEHACS